MQMNDARTFGRWVKQRRAAIDLTQEALAEQVGCATQTIRKIESGERRPSRDMAERLAQVLEIDEVEQAAFLKAARAAVEPQTVAIERPPVVKAPTPSAPRPALPSYSTQLFGREHELAEVLHLLADGQCQLISLVGPGGIGKTRLAIEAAGRCRQFEDGVIFVPLAAVTTPTQFVTAIGEALGVSFHGPDHPAAQLGQALHEKDALLVLDNFEHLVEHVETLATLLADAPGLKLMVTSRERLHLQGEWVVELAGLAVPQDGSADGAIALFVERAKRVQHGFQLRPEDVSAVVQICRLVDGMPLGIELAASWVRLLSCDEIVEQISSNFDFLEATTRDIPGRHSSLRAVFDHSWQLLSAAEQRALRRLSVFRGGFMRSAAEAIADASLPLLAALVDKSLLRRTEATGDGVRPGTRRYDLHELVRQYAAAKLADDPGEQSATLDRHCAIFVQMLAEREAAIKSARATATVEELRAEVDNIRLAWEWALKAGNLEAIEQARRTLHWFYETRTWFQEGEVVFGRAVAALQDFVIAQPEQRDAYELMVGKLLAHQGFFASRCGRLGAARAALELSLHILRGHSDQQALSDTLLYLGMVAYQMGDYADVRPLLDESLGIARQRGDRWNVGLALFFQGSLAYTFGDYAEAQQWFREDLQVWRQLGNPRGLSLCLNYYSLTLLILGAYDEATALLHESLGVCAAADDRWSFSTAMNHLGLVAEAQGNYQEAQYLYSESLSIFRDIGNRWDIVQSLNHLGTISVALNAYSDARRYFLEALETAMQAQAIPDAINALVGLAGVLAYEGRSEQALELCFHTLQHAASTKHAYHAATQLRAELEAALDPATVATVTARAASRAFSAVVAELTPHYGARMGALHRAA